jgi:hypothetical protein
VHRCPGLYRLDKGSLRPPSRSTLEGGRRKYSLFIATPDKLKDQYSFLSAMDAEVLRDSGYDYTLDTSEDGGKMLPDFEIREHSLSIEQLVHANNVCYHRAELDDANDHCHDLENHPALHGAGQGSRAIHGHPCCVH